MWNPSRSQIGSRLYHARRVARPSGSSEFPSSMPADAPEEIACPLRRTVSGILDDAYSTPATVRYVTTGLMADVPSSPSHSHTAWLAGSLPYLHFRGPPWSSTGSYPYTAHRLWHLNRYGCKDFVPQFFPLLHVGFVSTWEATDNTIIKMVTIVFFHKKQASH